MTAPLPSEQASTPASSNASVESVMTLAKNAAGEYALYVNSTSTDVTLARKKLWQEANDALRAEVEALATQRQGESETRDAALEQAANLVECEYAADATQGRRLAQIAQHIRDLKNRKPL